jgi:hypothetical protein
MASTHERIRVDLIVITVIPHFDRVTTDIGKVVLLDNVVPAVVEEIDTMDIFLFIDGDIDEPLEDIAADCVVI